jgi:glycosyltransferase involved in cell wall biosynthesis
MWIGRPAAWLVKWLFVRFHSKAALTFVTTPILKKQLQSFGVERVQICPLGVDDIFFAGGGTCPSTLTKPVSVYLGRLSTEKNVEEFLAADIPGTKLLVGDGPDGARLKERFPDARFLGFKGGAELINWCSCADVMVMPSRSETFGLAMIECLALGIPVAAHDVTGPREIVQNGVNGYLDADLAVAAKKCLSVSRDACRESVKHYTWSATADTFLSALRAARATS